MQNLTLSVDLLTQGLKYSISGLMNLTNQADEEPQKQMYYVNFNQDSTSLTVGDKSCFRIFSLNHIDFLEKIYENNTESVYIVERLFNSSLVAVVSSISPRKLKVCHFRKGTEICNYSYSNTILGVKLNRNRLVVCLEESMYIHNIKDMKVLHTIRDTPPNLTGLCVLSNQSEEVPCYIAYPGSNTTGEVQIFDATNLQAKIMIPAHDSPLAALAFNDNGTRIATASEKGTVIRVFSVNDGSKLYEFRRGVKRCVSINSLAFSVDSAFLCSSSNTETVHVFKLEEPKELPDQALDEPQGWMDLISKAVSASATYLPSQVTDVFTQGRAFSSIHLPVQGLKNVCGIAVIQKELRLLVASPEGYLYVYNLNTEEGGDCALYKQHRLDGKTDEVDGDTASPAADGDSAPGGDGDASIPVLTQTTACINSYAGALRGRSPDVMSESEKCQELLAATEAPPQPSDILRLDDEEEFPPMAPLL